jgi:hypothetical protein
MMDISTLKQIPSASVLDSDHLRAIWYDLHGDWDSAHRIVQGMSDVHAMWIHAYLHRKEARVTLKKHLQSLLILFDP